MPCMGLFDLDEALAALSGYDIHAKSDTHEMKRERCSAVGTKH